MNNYDDNDPLIRSQQEIGAAIEPPKPEKITNVRPTAVLSGPKYLDKVIRCTRRDLMWAYIEVFTLGILSGVVLVWFGFKILG